MRKVTKVFEVYKYEELDEYAQTRAMCDEVDFYMEVKVYELFDSSGEIKPEHKDSSLYRAVKKAEEMQTPWFLGNYILEFCYNEVMENIKAREYLKNGDIFTD